MSIYNELNNIEELFAEVADEETGEILEQDYNALKELEAEVIKNGFSNLYKVVRNIEAETLAIKNEKDQLAKKQKAKENQLKRVKDYIIILMDKTKQDKIKEEIFTFSLAITQSVYVTDESVLEAQFLKTKTEPNKTAIGDALKKGEQVNGAKFVQNIGLRIR